MDETESVFADQFSADHIRIDTPEQVTITLPVATVGSRLLALLVDTLVQGTALLIVFLLLMVLVESLHAARSTHTASGSARNWVIAGFVLAQFLFLWGYFSLFEAFWHGQTPGKRVMKLRVMQDTGRPITLFESLTRNLVRVIDMLPSVYLVGLVTMLLNRRAKRLGDLAAGTLVVHEHALPRGEGSAAARTITPAARPVAAAPAAASHGIPASALARLTPADVQLVEHYYTRNVDLAPEVRQALAASIAARIGSRLRWTAPDSAEHPERLLDRVHAALRGL